MKEIAANKKMKPVKTEADKSEVSINITAYAYQRMRYLVQNVDAEVAWFGTVTRDGSIFTIDEIFVPEQEVTASSVNAGAEEMSSLVPEIIEKYGEEKALNDIIPNMRAFCHSHHKMATFWSNTDEDGINGLANSQFLVSLVLNRDGNILGRVDLFSPLRVTLDKVNVCIDFDSTCDELAEEIKNKVTEKVFTPAKTTYNSYQKPGSTPKRYGYSGYGGYSGSGYGAYGAYDSELPGLDPIDDDKSKKETSVITTVSVYALPSAETKVTPELKPLEKLLRKSNAKGKPRRDLIFLIYASNYMNHSLVERKDELAEMFNDIMNTAETTVLSSSIQFEIASMLDMFADEEILVTKDPNDAVKGCTIASAHKLCDFIFKVKASETFCPRP
jgi:hypothetical protein